MMLALNTLSTNVVMANAARPSGPGSAIAGGPLSSGWPGLAGAASGRIVVAMIRTPLRDLYFAAVCAPRPGCDTDQSPDEAGSSPCSPGPLVPSTQALRAARPGPSAVLRSS